MSSWEDNFQIFLNELLQKKSTVLLTDEKVERIKSLIIDTKDGQKTDTPRFRQYVKDKGFQLVTCAVLGLENELCVPTKEECERPGLLAHWRRVVTVENMFKTLKLVHEGTRSHTGYHKLFKDVEDTFYGVPRSLCSKMFSKMEKEYRYETTVKRLIGHNLNAEENFKVQLYNDWSSTFETNNKQFGYTGNSKCCEVVCKYFPKNIEHIVMLDVGAGTGLLAEEIFKLSSVISMLYLASKGFKIIDGLDPSSGMLKEAEKKKTYRNLFCSHFTSKPLLFSNPDSYDLLAVVGSFVTGHIPYDAIIEMIRITKPGGIICIVNRRSPFYESLDYVDKFFPLCDQLEQEGKWKKEEITTFNGFIENADGTIIVYRVR